MKGFAAALAGSERLLPPGGGRTTAEPADLPESEQVEKRAEKRKEHHGDADGGNVETLRESPGGGSKHHGADADEQPNAMESDEGAANALDKGEEETGPIQPLETGGGWSRRSFRVASGGFDELSHERIP